MVTYRMPHLEQMASLAVSGLRKPRQLSGRLTVSSLRYSPVSAT